MIEPGIRRRGLILLLVVILIVAGTYGMHVFLGQWHLWGYDNIFICFVGFIFAVVMGIIALFCVYILYRAVLGPIAWLLYGDIDMSPHTFWSKVRGKA